MPRLYQVGGSEKMKKKITSEKELMMNPCYNNCPWIKHLDYLTSDSMFSSSEIFSMAIEGAIRRDTQIQQALLFIKEHGLEKEFLKIMRSKGYDTYTLTFPVDNK